MRKITSFRVVRLLVVLAGLIGFAGLIEAAAPSTDQGVDAREIAPAPDLEPFRMYLQVILGPTEPSVPVHFEGTLVDLDRSELCPVPEEVCPIPPYPNDWGRVRVERILSGGTPPGGPDSPEGAVKEHGADGGRSAPPNPGAGPTETRNLFPPALRPGQEVPVQFLLTARRTIVRRVPAPPLAEGRETVVRVPVDPATAVLWKPLPRKEDSYLFTVGVTAGSEPEEEILPGLESGDRFRAAASHDGVLRVRTYELLP